MSAHIGFEFLEQLLNLKRVSDLTQIFNEMDKIVVLKIFGAKNSNFINSLSAVDDVKLATC